MHSLVHLTKSLRPALLSRLSKRGQQQRWHSGHKPWSEIKDKTDFMSYCECQKAAIVLASWAVIGLGARTWLRRGGSASGSSEEPPTIAVEERAAV